MMDDDNAIIFCPECGFKIYRYNDGEWIVWICWQCGHYESNTPAFKHAPYLFVDLVRQNPLDFMYRYTKCKNGISPKHEHPNKTPEDGAEPIFILIY